jgi:hypothetical protein
MLLAAESGQDGKKGDRGGSHVEPPQAKRATGVPANRG